RTYDRTRECDELAIGGRVWTVRVGNGHADEHISLWSDDNIALVGDQILPAISPNLSIHFTEPAADCVSDWIKSCEKFSEVASDTTLCLPGHNRPFTGAPGRCHQLIENCHQVCSRILEELTTPMTALELMPAVYRRELSTYERNLLFGETMAYLNRLFFAGRITRRLSPSGVYRWSRTRNRSVS
ncbi:MAG: MBL fold metallo-hydrolase, partial [Planctomycetaceae bacterium]